MMLAAEVMSGVLVTCTNLLRLVGAYVILHVVKHTASRQIIIGG